MQSLDVDKELVKVFAGVFPNVTEGNFSWERKQNEYENWDSFAHLRLVSDIERVFNLRFDMDEIVFINSASGFRDLVRGKLNTL